MVFFSFVLLNFANDERKTRRGRLCEHVFALSARGGAVYHCAVITGNVLKLDAKRETALVSPRLRLDEISVCVFFLSTTVPTSRNENVFSVRFVGTSVDLFAEECSRYVEWLR